jgi:hypothetical protein
MQVMQGLLGDGALSSGFVSGGEGVALDGQADMQGGGAGVEVEEEDDVSEGGEADAFQELRPGEELPAVSEVQQQALKT